MLDQLCSGFKSTLGPRSPDCNEKILKSGIQTILREVVGS